MSNIVYFWGKGDIASNFYPAKFHHMNENFNCSEQAYMWRKGLHFEDFAMANKILLLTDPGQQKKAGRLISGFNQLSWDAVKREVMFQVVLAKFSQNPELKDWLLSTGDALLVEASPYDKVWGIGLNKYEAMSTPQSEWPGLNLLGLVLMDVRNALK
jgi:ribA/ribD-fused uncharacterized protein